MHNYIYTQHNIYIYIYIYIHNTIYIYTEKKYIYIHNFIGKTQTQCESRCGTLE